MFVFKVEQHIKANIQLWSQNLLVQAFTHTLSFDGVQLTPEALQITPL